jgi:hypothetical protein
MSNVIAFLESMGHDARLGRLAGAEYAAAVEALALDDAARDALLARDAAALNALLGGRDTVLFALLDEPEDAPRTPDDDEVRARGAH